MAETLLPGPFEIVDKKPSREQTPEAEVAMLITNGIDPTEVVNSTEAMREAAAKTGIPVEDLTG